MSDAAAPLTTAFAAHRRAAAFEDAPDAATRRAHLAALAQAVEARQTVLVTAIDTDFGGRSRHETLMAEVMGVLEACRHTRRHVKRWMRPERRSVSPMFWPGRAEIRFQPKGTVGIVAPWNYPVLLALGPLVGALAAGNRVMIKPSEVTPATADALRDLIAATFAADHVSVHTGDATVAQAFTRLPFDHLLFTGSTAIGRQVMRAAAENLVPVTLELGGKSPALVLADADPDKAAERIIAGKLFNAGQTCIAPDYVLLIGERREAFVSALRRVVARFYPSGLETADYSAIVTTRHKDRLEGLLRGARDAGATLLPLTDAVAPTGKMVPTVVLDPPLDGPLMDEEIFGPVLPIVTVPDAAAAIAFVNDRPRPLALYVFGREDAMIKHVLTETVSGGACVNDTLLHVAQEDLPFGGIGPSGMGAYHGRAGFETFSHAKSVFRQARFNGAGLANPPYGKTMERLLSWVLR